MSPDGYRDADGRARLVIARPTPSSVRLGVFPRARRAGCGRSRRRGKPGRHRAASSFDEPPLPPMRVEFAGGHRIAVETEAIVRRESIWNSVGSLALILPLLFLVFRSFWLVAVGSLPSALSLVLVLGALGFAGARLSAAATGAAAMLFGLGVDGVVLLYVAHQLALSEDPSTRGPAIEGPSVSMLLGMFTTAATFYGLMFVDFPSLRQLGRLIGHSMVACGVLTLVMVPALLPRRPPKRPRPSLLMPRWRRWIVRRRRIILWSAARLTVALGVAAVRLRVDPTLDRLRSTTDAARLEERIGPAFGLPGERLRRRSPKVRTSKRCSQTNERLIDRLPRGTPDAAGPAALAPAAVEGRATPHAGPDRRCRICRPIDSRHRSSRRASRQDFTAAPSTPSSSASARAARPAPAAHVRRLRGARRRRSDQSVRRPRRRRLAAGHLCVPDPTSRLPGREHRAGGRPTGRR